MGTKYTNDIKDAPEREVLQADRAILKIGVWDKKRETWKYVDADTSAKENALPMIGLVAKNNGYDNAEDLFYYERLVPPNNEINTWAKWRNMKLSADEFDKLQDMREEEREARQRAKEREQQGDDDDDKSYRKRK